MHPHLVTVPPQDLGLEHRHDQQRTVGKKPQSRGLAARQRDGGLELPGDVDGVYSFAVHVRKPQSVAAPARPFASPRISGRLRG